MGSFAKQADDYTAGLTGVITGAIPGSGGLVQPVPKFNLTGQVPIGSADIQEIDAGRRGVQKALDRLGPAAAPAGGSSRVRSFLNDTLNAINPFNTRGAVVSFAALMVGASPLTAMFAGSVASYVHGPAPQTHVDPRLRAAPQKPGYHPQSSPVAYSSWADQVAPISPPLGKKRVMEPSPGDNKLRGQLLDRQREYAQLMANLNGMVGRPHMNALVPDMVASKARENWTPTDFERIGRNGYKVGLDEVLGPDDLSRLKPKPAQMAALAPGLALT